MSREHAEPREVRRWSTRDVAPTERLDYFAAALSSAIVPFRVVEGDPHDFHAEVSFARLDRLGISKLRGSPHRSFRGLGELARTREHQFNLIMTLNACWSAEQRTRLQLQPRDVFIHDSEYPLSTDVRSPFVSVNVEMPADWLRRWVANPGMLVARRIAGESHWAAALAAYVGAISPELAAAPPLPLSLIEDQIGSLVALAASGLLTQAPLSATPAQRSLRDQILDCIVQRCTEPVLTAADVARSLDVSLRTLHRTLAVANETFGTKLIDARVRVAERMLVSPLFHRVTTAEIGRRAGFLSASHFARVVRSRTGRTPMQWRRAAEGSVDCARETGV